MWSYWPKPWNLCKWDFHDRSSQWPIFLHVFRKLSPLPFLIRECLFNNGFTKMKVWMIVSENKMKDKLLATSIWATLKESTQEHHSLGKAFWNALSRPWQIWLLLMLPSLWELWALFFLAPFYFLAAFLKTSGSGLYLLKIFETCFTVIN